MNPLRSGDPELVGGYRLLGRLGAGGMAQVFLGASPGGRKVAVKLVRPEYSDDGEFRRRFAREITAARQVGGFHTAAVVDADPDADPPWMVTAYIPGPSLFEAVGQNGPLGPPQVRELGAALAEGLTAIHACGLIHRDLKPGNIILGPDGPRIIDFGVARTANASSLTTVNALIGTYGYMAPEQLGRKQVTFQSDIFALGGVLVFAATGHGPFDADELPAVIGRILTEPPDLAPLTGSLRDILDACLTKDPDGRPSLADLIAYFAAPDQSAPPEPPGQAGPAVPAPRPSPPEADRTRVTDRDVARWEAAADPVDIAGRTIIAGAPPTLARLPQAGETVAPGEPGSLAPACSPLIGHTGPITLVAFAPDGALLATASADGRVRLWDTRSWRQVGPDLSARLPRDARDGGLAQLAFTPDGQAVLAKPAGMSAVFGWRVDTGAPLTTPVRTWARFISPDGRFLAAEGAGAPALWEWNGGALQYVPFPLQRKTGWRIGLLTAFSPDGRLIAATNPADDIGLWETTSRQQRRVLRRYRRSFDPSGQALIDYAVSAAVISPDGGFLAALGESRDYRDRSVRFLKLWDIADPHRRRRLAERSTATALSRWHIAFDADSQILASTFDGRLRLWDTATVTPTVLADAAEDAILQFAPGSALLAEASRFQLRLWDAAACVVTAAGPTIKAARDAIAGLAFSPDGGLLATAEGSAARVWHAPAR